MCKFRGDHFDVCERILIFVRSNVTDIVNNQKTLYYATSNNLFLHYLAKRGNTKIAFSLKRFINQAVG